jgi:hypothetical protein
MGTNETLVYFPGTEGIHFAGLPVTDGQWVADRDGTILGWFEVGRSVSVPDSSRYVRERGA